MLFLFLCYNMFLHIYYTLVLDLSFFIFVIVCTRTKSTITRSASRAGSTDSLARNSLLAAQVLRLIPTQEARERLFITHVVL